MYPTLVCVLLRTGFGGGHLWIDWDELKNPPPIPELVSGRIGWKEHTCDVTKAEIPLDFP